MLWRLLLIQSHILIHKAVPSIYVPCSDCTEAGKECLSLETPMEKHDQEMNPGMYFGHQWPPSELSGIVSLGILIKPNIYTKRVFLFCDEGELTLHYY